MKSLPEAHWQQELVELIVVRNLVTHNHVWRIGVTVAPEWTSKIADEYEHLYGARERRRYRAAIEDEATRTKRLRLNVVPTAMRRIDVGRALQVAVRTFDHLASIDKDNVASPADYPIRIGAQVLSLRDVATRI